MPPSPRRSRSPLSTRRAGRLGGNLLHGPLGAGALVAGALVAGACGGGGGTTSIGDARAAQVRLAAIDAGLDVEVADFLALAVRGDTATYAVTFPGATPGTELTIANRPPDRRIEVRVDGAVTEVRLVRDGEAIVCTPDAGLASGRCERTDAFVDPPGLFVDGAVTELASALADRGDDFTFAIEARTVAGTGATCLVTVIKTGRSRPDLGDGGTICVADSGALLLVDQAGERLEATTYTTVVDADAFDRPDGTETVPSPTSRPGT